MKIAALGYYGFGNLGDEAVLAGIQTALKTEPFFDQASLLVLSNTPEQTPRLHPGTTAVNRWRWRDVSQALSQTDLFILGGGSLLQDATSVKSVVWYALMAQLARTKSRRVLWWGQGVGPLRSKTSRFLVAYMGRQANAITVRDEKSAELLKGLGIRGSIEVVSDPAFALTPSNLHTTASSTILALRSWQQDEWIKRLESSSPGRNLREILQKATGDSSLEYLPMHQPDDSEMMATVIGTQSWDWRPLPIAESLGKVAKASLVIAMRLHALIFAARCAVPFVALSYDPKVDALAKASGQEDALLDINSSLLTQEVFLETIQQVKNTASERQIRLRDFAATQNVRAIRPASIAANLLTD